MGRKRGCVIRQFSRPAMVSGPNWRAGCLKMPKGRPEARRRGMGDSRRRWRPWAEQPADYEAVPIFRVIHPPLPSKASLAVAAPAEAPHQTAQPVPPAASAPSSRSLCLSIPQTPLDHTRWRTGHGPSALSSAPPVSDHPRSPPPLDLTQQPTGRGPSRAPRGHPAAVRRGPGHGAAAWPRMPEGGGSGGEGRIMY